jgi:hypothetical protein
LLVVVVVVGLAGCTTLPSGARSTTTAPTRSTNGTTTSTVAAGGGGGASLVAPAAPCQLTQLRLLRGRKAASKSLVEQGFLVLNIGTSVCSLGSEVRVTFRGAKRLAPKLGSFGPNGSKLLLPPQGEGGVVIAFVPPGGRLCGQKDNSEVSTVTLSWPGSSGPSLALKDYFHSCPKHDPTIELTDMLTYFQYESFLPGSSGHNRAG